MKSYKDIKVNILEQTSNKSVVFTFGRFQPPTSGHQLLINKVIKEARKLGAEHRIYPSHSNDAKQNPLSHKDKVLYMRKLFPKANIVDDKKAVNPFNVLESLSKEGYKNVYFMVGGDRVSEFKKGMGKYVGKDGYDFDTFKVISAGHRDPDAEGVVGMSGSKMRKAAKDKEFESFLKGVPNKTPEKVSLGLFKAIRKGMGLKEQVVPGQNFPDCEGNVICVWQDPVTGLWYECVGGEGCSWRRCYDCGKTETNTINNKVADKTFNVRVADTGASRAKGLMHETYLDDDDGMLFVFDEENYHGIWMKNTHIPLDCVWINESGIVVDIKRLHPHNLDTQFPVNPAKYVLEVNAGTFDGAIGDTLAERSLLRKLKMDKFSRSERKREKKRKKGIRKYNKMVGIPLAASYDGELNESVDDNFENMLTELSIESRRKMARAAKRTAKRRAAKRKIKARRMKGAAEMQIKARKSALMGFKKKMLKGRAWSGLGHAEKENITRRMKKKYSPARIAKVAQKLLPGLRKKERERVAALKGGGDKNEQVEYLTEPQALENLVKKLKSKNPSWSDSKAFAIATAQLQKSGVLKKGTHDLEERNYKLEYANYQGRPDQIERRSSRNKARRKLEKEGRVYKGDDRDIDHKDRNPLNNDGSNLRVKSKRGNRSFSRKTEERIALTKDKKYKLPLSKTTGHTNNKFYQGKRQAMEDGTNRARNEYQRATPGQPSWDGDPEIKRYYKND